MRIGILGGGQLARMLALAGYPLGLRFTVFDPEPHVCAADVAEHVCGSYEDSALLQTFAKRVDVITYEFENVPSACLNMLSQHAPIYPSLQALTISQERLSEKNLFATLNIPTPKFAAIDAASDLASALAHVGYPAILKTRRMGYDGKGQLRINNAADLHDAWQRLGSVPLIAEAVVPFEREVSIIAARNRSGAMAYYDLSENVHQNGILHTATRQRHDPLQAKAESYVQALMTHLDYVGVLTLELFQVGETLIANEFAPRVHNSGHWTIEGACTSQFENHLRATLNLPLGATQATGYAAMVNFIGAMPPRDAILQLNAHLHDYGKSPRPGRKLGHATIVSDDPAIVARLVQQVCDLDPRRDT